MTYLHDNMGLNARKLAFGACKEQRRRPACTSAQSGQCLWYSLIEKYHSKLATSEISIFLLVSVAEHFGLCMSWSETLKTGFLATRPV